MPSDNVTSNPGSGGATFRTLADAGSVEWSTSVLAYATTVSAGANVLQVVTPSSPLPVTDPADGSISGGTAGSMSEAVGGLYNTSLPTLTNGQQCALQLTSNGLLYVDVGAALPAGGNIIGIVSINQTTPGTTNAVSVPDQASTTGTITAADTATSTTTGANGQTIITGTPTANSSFTIALSGEASLGLTLTGNTGGSTYVFEKSADGGTTYVATSVEAIGASSANANIVSSITASKSVMRAAVAGFTNFRVRCTIFISGTTTTVCQPGYEPGLLAAGLVSSTAGVIGGVEVYDAAGSNKLLVSSNGAASVNVTYVGGSAFALGQQLAAASLPVVLTASQISTLTPLTSVTVVGDAANGVTAAGNPVQMGGVATNVEQTAVTTGQAVQAAYTLTGKAIVSPYANPENTVQFGGSATDGSAHNIFASQGTGLRSYITNLSFSNTSATTITVAVSDGTTTFTFIVPAGGGTNLNFSVPLRFAAATAVTYTVSTGVSTVYVNAAGFKGV